MKRLALAFLLTAAEASAQGSVSAEDRIAALDTLCIRTGLVPAEIARAVAERGGTDLSHPPAGASGEEAERPHRTGRGPEGPGL